MLARGDASQRLEGGGGASLDDVSVISAYSYYIVPCNEKVRLKEVSLKI